MSDKVDQPVVSGTPVRPKKRHTCARHCKRFWWIYLIVSIIIIVLAVCLIIFVAVPKIAQHKINDAHLEIQGVNVLQTTSDKYLMEINSTITTDGKIKADIDAFEGVMYLEDLEPHTPFVSLEFPATNGDKLQLVNTSQEITITDMDAFTNFNIWFANNKTLRVTVEGKTKVKPKGLSRKYNVDFKKTVEINGLDLFSGTDVLENESKILPLVDGKGEEPNFVGIANIPNHSVFTLDIGNVTWFNYLEDADLGELKIDNLVLVPGNNRLTIRSWQDRSSILKALETEKYCHTGIMDFKLLGKKVVNHGEDISYFKAGLAENNQTVSINIGKVLEDTAHIKMKCRS